MRYLGIDFGRARIGIAISDPDGRIAFPKKVLLNNGNARLADELKSIIAEDQISHCIVGLPLGASGEETEESKEVRKFAAWFRGIADLPVEFENEVFTTRMAEHPGVAKSQKDASSAAIILQSYLDKHNTHSIERKEN